jgi:hypothetical protein
LFIVTDSLGFFAQEVPPGEYWIGSVLTEPSRKWAISYYYSNYEYQRSRGGIIRWPMAADTEFSWGRHSAEKPDSTFPVDVGRATDLGYLVLSTAIMHVAGWTPGLDRDYAIPAYLKTLEGHRSFQNEFYYHQTVPAYFVARFPDSEWAPALKQSLRTSYPDILRLPQE